MISGPLAPTPPGVDVEEWSVACAAIRAYCGWHIAPVITEDVTVDGSGGGVQLLPTLRLLDVAAVTNDGQSVADPQWSESGVIRGVWTGRYRGVTATITHGYETCPAEVLAVAKSMAVAGATAAATPGVKRMTSGPYSVEFSEGAMAGPGVITEAHAAILDRYKLPFRP